MAGLTTSQMRGPMRASFSWSYSCLMRS